MELIIIYKFLNFKRLDVPFLPLLKIASFGSLAMDVKWNYIPNTILNFFCLPRNKAGSR